MPESGRQMDSMFFYLAVAGAGVLMAHFVSRAPELRTLRPAQLVLVPGAMVLCVFMMVSPGASVGGGLVFCGTLLFLAALLAPNVGFHLGAAVSNFLDPQDWTPAEEEIALRPIRRLIDEDKFFQALGELEELLKKHKPTYEAGLLKAKLLYHFGKVDETAATLLGLIGLSKSTEQQLGAMKLLGLLEEPQQNRPKPLAPGTRPIQTHHDLVLFQMSDDPAPLHKEIPPGTHEVEEAFHRNHRWLKLAGEDWGNDERCWEAILEIRRPADAPPKKGLIWKIARMQQALAAAIGGKPRIQQQAEAQKLLIEANQLIRRDDWPNALPLLQKASAFDPDRYEIAYRWVQAVGHTSSGAAAAQAVSRVLKQSQWTEDQEHMLEQLLPGPQVRRQNDGED